MAAGLRKTLPRLAEPGVEFSQRQVAAQGLYQLSCSTRTASRSSSTSTPKKPWGSSRRSWPPIWTRRTRNRPRQRAFSTRPDPVERTRASMTAVQWTARARAPAHGLRGQATAVPVVHSCAAAPVQRDVIDGPVVQTNLAMRRRFETGKHHQAGGFPDPGGRSIVRNSPASTCRLRFSMTRVSPSQLFCTRSNLTMLCLVSTIQQLDSRACSLDGFGHAVTDCPDESGLSSQNSLLTNAVGGRKLAIGLA